MRIILVADKKANKFLSNLWNIGPVDKHSIITGDIVKSVKGAGLFKWNGEPWDDESPPVMVHNRQVTKDSEIQPIIGGLLTGGYETAIIGCDPSTAPYLTSKLRETFGSENLTEIYPYLDDGIEQYKDLGDRIKELLDQTGVKRSNKTAVGSEGSEGSEGSVGSEESEESEESEDSKKERTLHLKVTLTNTNDPGIKPKTIDVFYNEGTNIELDLRDTTKDTA